jgi:hypothetical protein
VISNSVVWIKKYFILSITCRSVTVSEVDQQSAGRTQWAKRPPSAALNALQKKEVN